MCWPIRGKVERVLPRNMSVVALQLGSNGRKHLLNLAKTQPYLREECWHSLTCHKLDTSHKASVIRVRYRKQWLHLPLRLQ